MREANYLSNLDKSASTYVRESNQKFGLVTMRRFGNVTRPPTPRPSRFRREPRFGGSFVTAPTGGLSNFLLRRGQFRHSILAAIVRALGDPRYFRRRPQLRVLTREHPKLVYRPLSRGYLATCFRKKQRRQILEHYLYLTNRLSESFFSQIARQTSIVARAVGPVQSWSHFLANIIMKAICCSSSNRSRRGSVASVSAREHLVGSATAQATLIARIQGVRGQFATIRHATKTSLILRR